MELRILKLSQNSEIEKYELLLKDQLPIFHTQRWLQSLGSKVEILICYAGDAIAAYLPLVKTRKFGYIGYHIPPYTAYFGPLIFEGFSANQELILKSFNKFIRLSRHSEFKMKNENNDIVSYKSAGYSITATQNYYFPPNQHYDLQTVKSVKRRDIIKLEALVKQNKLIITENEQWLIPDLIELLKITGKRAGYNPKINTLEKIFESLNPDDYYINLIKDANGASLAGSFCPKDTNGMYHLVSASRRVDDKLLNSCNSLALFLAVSYANKTGLEFDFEGSNIAGVANFYRLMGAIPRIVYRYQKSRSIYYQLLLLTKRIIDEHTKKI
jgi:hypothetical protein